MRVFVSVGTQKFPFNRLIQTADEAAAQFGPDDRFFAQTGFSTYEPQHFTFKPFLQKEEFEEQIRSCDLLIVHGGVGTIITALKYGKNIIVIPRQGRYGEHVDDHQMQIAESFAQKDLVLCWHEGDDLAEMMRKAMEYTFAPYVSHRADMVSTIEQYLASLN